MTTFFAEMNNKSDWSIYHFSVVITKNGNLKMCVLSLNNKFEKDNS